MSMNEQLSAVPLCIPNNYQWEESESRLVPSHGVKRSKLLPCEEGLNILRSIKGPPCVVCVVGPARTGKSYLLSQLQGSNFPLGHTMKAETMGMKQCRSNVLSTLTTVFSVKNRRTISLQRVSIY